MTYRLMNHHRLATQDTGRKANPVSYKVYSPHQSRHFATFLLSSFSQMSSGKNELGRSRFMFCLHQRCVCYLGVWVWDVGALLMSRGGAVEGPGGGGTDCVVVPPQPPVSLCNPHTGISLSASLLTGPRTLSSLFFLFFPSFSATLEFLSRVSFEKMRRLCPA